MLNAELRVAYEKFKEAGKWDKAYLCASNDVSLVKDFRESITPIIRKDPSRELLDYLKESYFLTAKDNFDDYMVAMEWDRPSQAKFWLPRRKVLEGNLKICTTVQEFIDDEESKLLSLSLPPGTGKALANDTPILTRKGWKNHGDLVVGDEVIGMDGEFKKVIAVHPKCQLDRLVEFTNGEKIQCHARHEWLLYDRHSLKTHLEETQYWETRGIESDCIGRGHRYHLQLPLKSAIKGEEKDLFDPYTLGVWLGDGANKNPRICGDEKDKAIIDKIPYPVRWSTRHKDTGVIYYDFDIRKELQKYDMCHSRKKTAKHIPEEYLTASINQRLELLAGLIDTDGTYTKEGKYRFSTADVELKDGFIELVSTFGIRCCVIKVEPTTSSSGITARRPHWEIQFVPNMEIPCVLERKKTKRLINQRMIAIKSITKVEPKEGNCITVEGDGMYLAGRTMLPTHNTTLIKFLISYIMGKFPQSDNMYCTYSDAMVKIMYDSLEAMTDDKGEYNFNRIFGMGKPLCNAEYRTLSYRNKGDFPTVGLVALGGSVTGRTRANKFFITDDLVKNKEEARSPERLEKLYDDYNTTLKTRRIGDNCKEIMLGTIWSLYDPISRRKTRDNGKKGYYFIAYPVCDEKGHSNFMYEHEDRYTDEVIAQLKEDLDPADFSCLYMQQGVQKEGMAFPKDRLKFIYDLDEIPKEEPDNIFFWADVAWGGGDSFSVPICYKWGDKGYILDVMFDRSDKTITIPRLAGKIIKNKVKMGGVEANNGGASVCDDLREILRKQGYSCNLSSHRAKGETNKLIRIEQHQQAIRNLYFLADRLADTEYKNFMSELETFSFTSKNLHDDAPDSLAGLISFESNHIIIKVGNRPF